ncbi:unnamed protein product [Peniophora sp. CBMAI 1063]|nr:unnamed protein product [Peniophora sp. CBMAI 1063]
MADVILKAVRIGLLDLPNELLMLIVIHDHRSIESPRVQKPVAFLWQGICRRLYAICRAAGEIWAHITDIYNFPLTSIAVERSGAHLLTLDLGPPSGALADWRHGMAILEPHHHRVQTIRVDYTGFDESEDNMDIIPPWHLPFLYGDWTALETFEFSNYWFDALFSKDSFFCEPPASWRKLALRDCSLRDPFHVFQVPLTHLRLERCDLHCGLVDFIRLINSLPTLTSLALIDTFGEEGVGIEETTVTRPEPGVHLPHLLQLELDAAFERVIFIASGLEVPDCCAVSMRMATPRSNQLPASYVPDALDRAFSSRLTKAFQGIDADASPQGCHMVFGDHDDLVGVSIELSARFGGQGERRHFLLSLRPTPASPTWPELPSIVGRILSWDPFSAVTFFRGVRVPLEGNMWQQILQKMPILRCLQADFAVAGLDTALTAVSGSVPTGRLTEVVLNSV